MKTKTQHTQRLWDATEAGLKGKFIAVNQYIIKEESSEINDLGFYLRN